MSQDHRHRHRPTVSCLTFRADLRVLSGATSTGNSSVRGTRTFRTVRPSMWKSGISIGFVRACNAVESIVVLPSMGNGVTLIRIHGNGSMHLHIWALCWPRSRLKSRPKCRPRRNKPRRRPRCKPSCKLVCMQFRLKPSKCSLTMMLVLCACFGREVPPAAAAGDHREPERTSHYDAATDDHRSPSELPLHAADAARSSHHSAVVPILRTRSTSTRTWAARITSGVIPRSWLGLERLGYSNGINCTLECNRRWFERHVMRGWIKHVAQQRLPRFYALLDELFGHRIPMRVKAIIEHMVGASLWPRITPISFRPCNHRD